MIISIDGLKLPAYLSGSAELFNADTRKRTVSQKLITKLSATEKWRITLEYDSTVLSAELQTAFYEKCLALRIHSAPITFISPYDGREYTINAKCVSRSVPSPIILHHRRPLLYRKVGAVFEEV